MRTKAQIQCDEFRAKNNFISMRTKGQIYCEEFGANNSIYLMSTKVQVHSVENRRFFGKFNFFL